MDAVCARRRGRDLHGDGGGVDRVAEEGGHPLVDLVDAGVQTGSDREPWAWPGTSISAGGTPASRSRSAYRRPSSRRGSTSTMSTSAGAGR